MAKWRLRDSYVHCRYTPVEVVTLRCQYKRCQMAAYCGKMSERTRYTRRYMKHIRGIRSRRGERRRRRIVIVHARRVVTLRVEMEMPAA